MASRERLAVGALLILLTLRLGAAVVVVPPWQHPDEPQHVEYIVSLVRTGAFRPLQTIDPTVSSEVVRSMASHGWWSYLNRPLPSPLPTRVAEITEGDALMHPRAYYLAGGLLLRMLGVSDLMPAYWALRLASAVVGLLTALVIWAGTRRAFGTLTGMGTLALLSFHPQFALVSTAANPDGVVNLAGALIWWCGVGAIAGPRRLVNVAAAIVAAIAAALSKRAGVPLLALPVVVCVLLVPVIWMADRRRLGRLLLLVVVPATLAALLGALLLPEWMRAYEYGTTIFRMPTLVAATSDPDFLRDFSRNLFQSGWLNAGWLTLPEIWPWYAVAMAITALALLSLVRLVLPGIDTRTRIMLLLASVFVAIQVAAIYATYFRAGYPAQGRYVFPVMGPLLALVWTGGVSWTPRRWRVVPAALLVAVAFALDVHGWVTVILPGFSR